MSAAIVFLGPTLTQAAAREVLAADYWPPVVRGDVLRALYRKPCVIAIVDGCFHSVRSVWHKEILVALESGVRVFGAASMGALRAAELHAFGMTGIGEIFARYLSGACEDDDEVAVVHLPAEQGFLPLTEAMVDLRDAYGAAAEAGALSGAVADGLTAIAKRLHYTERSHQRVLALAAAAGVEARQLAALRAFLPRRGPSLKQRDALAMLAAVAAELAAPSPSAQLHVSVARTAYLRALEAEVRAREFPWGRVILSRAQPPLPATRAAVR